MTALELLVVAAVLAGMSLQAAIGFGFAFCVAPAAFAAYPPEEAVMLVLILAIAINSLVLFAERRSPQVAVRMSATIVLAAVPAMLIGVWLLQLIDRQVLQVLVGVVILIGAAVQIRAATRARERTQTTDGAPVAVELAAGFAAGVLTTSISVNGPVLVLALTHLGLRGNRLRDSLAATLLGLSLAAVAIVLVTIGLGDSLPDGCHPRRLRPGAPARPSHRCRSLRPPRRAHTSPPGARGRGLGGPAEHHGCIALTALAVDSAFDQAHRPGKALGVDQLQRLPARERENRGPGVARRLGHDLVGRGARRRRELQEPHRPRGHIGAPRASTWAGLAGDDDVDAPARARRIRERAGGLDDDLDRPLAGARGAEARRTRRRLRARLRAGS